MLGYERGLDRVVLYPNTGDGIFWTGVSESNLSPEDTKNRSLHYDGVKYHNTVMSDSTGVALSVYTYPPELDSGGRFGLTYRTENEDLGYAIHILYHQRFTFGEMVRKTISGSGDVDLFTITGSSTPSPFGVGSPTSHVIVDSRYTPHRTLEMVESTLYGSDAAAPRLPDIKELYEIFESNMILRITDHGDGIWSADGPSSAIVMITDTEFEITWPSVIFEDSRTYKISSL